MLRNLILACSATTLLTACIAVDNSVAGLDPAKTAVATDDLVKARQGNMRLAAIALGSVGSIADAEDMAASRGAFAASGLAKFGDALPVYFGIETRMAAAPGARDTIWTDRAGFAARAQQFETATAQLASAAAADDRPAFVSAVASTKAACKACHDAYRVEDD